MKYSEKLQLLLKGVKMEEIKDLEAQEQAELEAVSSSEELDKSEKEQDNSEALEAAKSMIEELETKLGNAQDELTRLNSEIAAINNRATQAEDLPKYDATAVFGELFNKAKQEV